MYEKQPWLKHYGGVPHSLNYPDKSMYAMVKESCMRYPDACSLIFFGKKTSRHSLDTQIVNMSRAFSSQGIKRGDIVIVCLPNIPQAIISLYALNRLGAIPAPIHPLSASSEIESYAKLVGAKTAVTLDGFFPRFKDIIESSGFTKIIVCSLKTEMGIVTKLGFSLTTGRKIKKVPFSDKIVSWHKLQKEINLPEIEAVDPIGADDTALILFSGGTTGEAKAIMLTSRNCNALAIQMDSAGSKVKKGDKMLSILPVFHGFGLCVGIHTMLIYDGICILVPKFKADSLAGLIRKHKPQFMAGVPTLFDALAADEKFNNTNLSSFKGLFCGGDSLSPEVKERFEAALKKNGCNTMLREGYGLTESVTACIIMPPDQYRLRSIGIPCPDTWFKVIKLEGQPGSYEECDEMQEGEICVSGPTIMKGYYNDLKTTNDIVKRHADGKAWLHTGDIGCMDADGFFYFKQRIKRIIKTSGIAVYPSQIEDVLCKHPAVRLACVIGIPHASQGEVPKAFVMLNKNYEPSDKLKQEIIESCKNHLMPHARPRNIEFVNDMPMTRVGKVAYRELEEREKANTSN